MGYYDMGDFYNFRSGYGLEGKWKSGKNFDKFVDKDFKLKNGYESLNYGAGPQDRLVATYTNDFDDNHDDFDAKYDVKKYGIYKKAQAAPAPAPKPAPPAPAPLAAISNPSNTTAAGKQYQSQIAALTASLKAQQQQSKAAQQKQAANAQQQQAAAAAALQKTYQSQVSKMQGLFASNLQSTKDQFGLQIKGLKTGYGSQISGLQSNISGLQSNISGLKGTISDNAAAYQQNIADQGAQFKTEQQTMLINQERARQAGATPRLRLQEAQDMKQAGTKNFKKRIGSQFNPTAYGSLASIKSGTLNI